MHTHSLRNVRAIFGAVLRAKNDDVLSARDVNKFALTKMCGPQGLFSD
jgi:hypothetical protein